MVSFWGEVGEWGGWGGGGGKLDPGSTARMNRLASSGHSSRPNSDFMVRYRLKNHLAHK